jgi:hypothetical protein
MLALRRVIAPKQLAVRFGSTITMKDGVLTVPNDPIIPFIEGTRATAGEDSVVAWVCPGLVFPRFGSFPSASARGASYFGGLNT